MVGFDKDIVWHDVLESVRVNVSPAIFSTWFANSYLISLKKVGERYFAEIGCVSPFAKSTLESRYFGLIQDTIMRTISFPCDLTFQVSQKHGESQSVPPAPLFVTRDTKEEISQAVAKAKLRPGFTFSNFAVSSSNQMAYAAAEAVAANPGRSYNPLFIWGGVGVGKSHLMVAVGHSVLEKDQDKKVVFCTGEDFTNEIVEGIRNKSTQLFRDKYRKAAVLLIDDIQFIAGKDTVQEEFFHTFNAITSVGGQVILTSDRPPSEISKLEERLQSRFEAGLIVDIAPPDFELRCAIVQIKCAEKGIDMPMNLIQVVAGNVESARKIEGILTRILSETKLKKIDLTEEVITSILGKSSSINGDNHKSIEPSKVVDAVTDYYSLSKKAILSHVRSRSIAHPRQILMYLLRTELNIPLEAIGEMIGGRDHTTVMHAVDKVGRELADDVRLREDLMGIKKRL